MAEPAAAPLPPPAPDERGAGRLGAAARRWPSLLRELWGASLPLLLMAVLAAGSWWAVRVAPKQERLAAPTPDATEPDYALESFTLWRYAPDGAFVAEIRGEQLRHRPVGDTLEVDVLRLDHRGADGRRTLASARQGWVGKGAEVVELRGGAHLSSALAGAEPVFFQGEHFRYDSRVQRLSGDQPILARQGRSEFRAQALEYDGLAQRLTLKGPARVVLMPETAAPAR
ncbi:LPS export ABC transporter periplasmic protein LptC [Ideonella livida]|uniref:LPS export ABC transporter periplasmic protein LptC n=1 Tax=Ideonella livida TaxID=2707176 RepID=A0A7C9TMS7_9BURK|nr:LPS export ABC transporter periplasmic protein LptC [Ideonella livida]NDY91906.1 LPS export ABC transporter periplasmic protein LptC [Ideonella livida]